MPCFDSYGPTPSLEITPPASKLIIGASMALPASNLRLSKHLAMIAGGLTAGRDSEDRRRVRLFDLGFCWGIPAIFMALRRLSVIPPSQPKDSPAFQTVLFKITGTMSTYILAADHRHIRRSLALSSFGPHLCSFRLEPPCMPVHIFSTHPTATTTSDISSGIALRHFVRVRREFASTLQASSSPMSTNRYGRLMALSVTLMVWGTMLTSLNVWVNTRAGIKPCASWKKVHSYWNLSDPLRWPPNDPLSRRIAMVTWWVIPVSTIISFIFLGFGEDAVREYKRLGEAIVRKIPSSVLPKWIKKFSNGLALAPLRPSSCSGFVVLLTLRSRPLTFSNVALMNRPFHFRQMRQQRTERSRSSRRLNLPDLYVP